MPWRDYIMRGFRGAAAVCFAVITRVFCRESIMLAQGFSLHFETDDMIKQPLNSKSCPTGEIVDLPKSKLLRGLMNVNKKLSIGHWVIILLLPCLISSCVREPRIPLVDGIPSQDIVFMPDNPVNSNNDGYTLGFVDSYSAVEVYYTFKIIGGARSNIGVSLDTQQAKFPRWSRSGSTLAFSIASTMPNIRLIDSQGKMYGRKCLGLDQQSTFDKEGNIMGVIPDHSPDYPTYREMITPSTSLVAGYDLITCKIQYVVSIPVPQNSQLNNISEAENGLITGEYFETDTYGNKIMVFDPPTQKFETFPGYHPSLSSDGAMLAYFDEDGNLVVRDTDTNDEKIITNASLDDSNFYPEYVFLPGWSPSNQWLVYNTVAGEIYIANIETGERRYIIDGWAPDWRP